MWRALNLWKNLEILHPNKHDEYLVTLYYPRITTSGKWYNKEQHFLDKDNQKMNVIAWDYMPKPFMFEYEKISQFVEDYL